ncbi:MAG: GNAT family N-acetyltransferase [Gemmatimonadales bacterium]
MQTSLLGRYTTRLLTPPDLHALQALFERGSDYFERVTGRPPAADEAPRAFVAGPPTKEVNDKRTVGLFTLEHALVGVLDAIADWPDDGTWTVGMLLLDPAHRGFGVGSAWFAEWCTWAASEGARGVRTAVTSDDARAERHLIRLGFTEENRVADYDAGGRRPTIVFYRRGL